MPSPEMERSSSNFDHRCTVIVLNFNGERLLPACLDSLARQTCKNFDVVIVDNGSSDGSARLVAQRYPWARLVTLDKNYGFSKANNVGLGDALSRGSEFALLLNNDTYAAPDFLSQMLTVIQGDLRIAAVCPKIYFAEQPETLWYAGADFSLWTGTPKFRGWKQIDDGEFDFHQEITQATGCAMLVRANALSDVGLLDEQFWAYAEDLDWSLRFLKRGYRIVFAPKARLWHYDGATAVKSMGAGSQALRQFLSTRNMVFVGRKHLRWWQTPTYVLGFMFNHIAFYTVLRLWQHDFRAVWAIYRGLGQGLRTSLSSGCADETLLSQKEEVLNANRN
jgi:GT2 family glycosyltransferase